MQNKTIIILGILLVSTIIFGFATKPNETPRYDYVQIVQNNKYLAISSVTEYKQTNISEEREGNYDHKPVLKVINEYQREGYELVEHSIAFANLEITASYLMRKQR